MRADRLLSILMLLQVHRRMTARELARRLEVSERTIHRDMEALSAAGVPVLAERGTGGGWVLPESYRTNLTGLNPAEIQSVFLPLPPGVLADLGLDKAAEGAAIKLLAALPSVSRHQAEFVRGRIHVDSAGWHQGREAVPHLVTIQEAIWQERKLQFTYERSDGAAPSERLADPLGLVVKGSIWYLVAMVDGEVRTYRVSRFRSAAIADAPCVRPPDFDLAAFWSASSAQFVASLPRYPVTVRAAAKILPRMQQAARWSRVEQVSEPDADGWVTVQLRFEEEPYAVEFVLSFGPRIEILEPVALREQVAQAAAGIVALYAAEGSIPE